MIKKLLAYGLLLCLLLATGPAGLALAQATDTPTPTNTPTNTPTPTDTPTPTNTPTPMPGVNIRCDHPECTAPDCTWSVVGGTITEQTDEYIIIAPTAGQHMYIDFSFDFDRIPNENITCATTNFSPMSNYYTYVFIEGIETIDFPADWPCGQLPYYRIYYKASTHTTLSGKTSTTPYTIDEDGYTTYTSCCVVGGGCDWENESRVYHTFDAGDDPTAIGFIAAWGGWQALYPTITDGSYTVSADFYVFPATPTPTATPTTTGTPAPTATPVYTQGQQAIDCIDVSYIDPWATRLSSVDGQMATVQAQIVVSDSVLSNVTLSNHPFSLIRGLMVITSDIPWLQAIFAWFFIAFSIIVLLMAVKFLTAQWGIFKRIKAVVAFIRSLIPFV